jgi:hypothetical protein
MTSPASITGLLASERSFVSAMQRLRFGRFELVQIRNGELVHDPCPTVVQTIKFGAGDASRALPEEFELKHQVIELFDYVREVRAGVIRCLEVRHGLPFSMEIEHRPEQKGGQNG